jgi:hypothetical protein
MHSRPQRVTENQSNFRAANERRFGVLRFLPGSGVYVCECGREDCTEPIRLRSSEYTEARADPARFMVVTGHVDHELEVVVKEMDGWVVVEKVGEAGEAARKAAPTEPE